MVITKAANAVTQKSMQILFRNEIMWAKNLNYLIFPLELCTSGTCEDKYFSSWEIINKWMCGPCVQTRPASGSYIIWNQHPLNLKDLNPSSQNTSSFVCSDDVSFRLINLSLFKNKGNKRRFKWTYKKVQSNGTCNNP